MVKGYTDRDGTFHPITQYIKSPRKSRDQTLKLEGVKVVRKQRLTFKDNRHDMAQLILQDTNDGDDLSTGHLRLVEGAVNDALTEKGQEAFTDLYRQVKSGTYTKPFFHGIPNMTQDHEGYIYWKGKRVEHYSFDDWEQEDFSARELAEVIKDMEKIGMPVTGSNIMSHYDIFREEHPEWKRNQFLVMAFDKDGRRVGAEWIKAIDREGAEKEFIRQNKAGSLHEEYTFDHLDAISDAEASRRQQADWEERTGRKLKR